MFFHDIKKHHVVDWGSSKCILMRLFSPYREKELGTGPQAWVTACPAMKRPYAFTGPTTLANADLSLPDTAVVFSAAACPRRPHTCTRMHTKVHPDTEWQLCVGLKSTENLNTSRTHTACAHTQCQRGGKKINCIQPFSSWDIKKHGIAVQTENISHSFYLPNEWRDTKKTSKGPTRHQLFLLFQNILPTGWNSEKPRGSKANRAV